MESWNADIHSSLYRPLEGELPLRLLKLEAGLPGQPIECKLVPTHLAVVAEQYEATSYTWGSPVDPQVIRCNGASMRIQKNAFDMLHGLRWPNQARTIWIDAICIDQSNIDERASQVAMMCEIYRRAKHVVVWLGPPDDDSRVAMAYARTLDSAALIREHIAVTDGAGDYLQAAALQSKTYHFDEQPQDAGFRARAVAILRFLQRPWFNRVWIQQEAALCWHTRVCCGDDAVEWDQIFALAWVVHPRQAGGYPDYVEAALGTVFYNLSAILEIERFRNRLFSERYGASRTAIYLLHTLDSARRFGATDPRDKVFALQNLATDADRWVQIDYRVPWQLIYLEVGRICLESGWLDFLGAAGKTRQQPGSSVPLPSWAPDYRGVSDYDSSMKEQPSWMPGGGIPGLPVKRPEAIASVHPLPKPHRRRGALSPEIKSYKGSRKQLLHSYASVKCTMSDEIVYLSRVFDEVHAEVHDNAGTSMHLHIIDEDLRHVATMNPQTYLNGELLSDAYKLTLILGCDEYDNAVGPEFVQDNWDDWIRWLKGGPEEWEGECKPPSLHGSVRASRISDQFRFAVTRHGYFCLVPRLAELHDEVAIFPGYQLGVVIRPWHPQLATTNGAGEEKEAEYHEFVGDAYIHGMMRNEAQCIIEEFGCKYKPSESQWSKILRESDEGNGEGWQTLGFSGNYSRILPTLGGRRVKLV